MFLYLSYTCSSCCNFISYFFQSSPFASKLSFGFSFKFNRSILHSSSDLEQQNCSSGVKDWLYSNFQMLNSITCSPPLCTSVCYPLLYQLLFPTCSHMPGRRSLLCTGYRECCTCCVAKLEQRTLSISFFLADFLTLGVLTCYFTIYCSYTICNYNSTPVKMNKSISLLGTYHVK